MATHGAGLDGLCADLGAQADAQLSHADRCVTQLWAQPIIWRQPIHTVYVPAHWLAGEGAAPLGMTREHEQMREMDPADLVDIWGRYARETLLQAFGATGVASGVQLCGDGATPEVGTEPTSSRDALGAAVLALARAVDAENAEDVAALTAAKLLSQPIEDLRVDFEDGFTQRHVPAEDRDADEDRLVAVAARAVTSWLWDGPGAASGRDGTDGGGVGRAAFSETGADGGGAAAVTAEEGADRDADAETTRHADASRDASSDTNRDADPATHGDAPQLWSAPPTFVGIRFKSFDPATRARGLRTLVLFLSELHAHGTLRALLDPASPAYSPRSLRLTFPKVQHPDQVRALVEVLEQLELRFGLAEAGARIPFEIQVETPQSIVGEAGAVAVTQLLDAAQGRCLSMHYGTYDYSAYLGVDAAHQSLAHPVADAAKGLIQIACAGRGVEVSDGSTNRIPTLSARPGTPGDQDVREHCLAPWRNHHSLALRHLQRGIRQGWDLHPNQLVTRHLATIEYFRASARECIDRTRDYVRGDTTTWMDEPATAKAMAGYLLRARDCGAVTEDELASTGVDATALRELRLRGRCG